MNSDVSQKRKQLSKSDTMALSDNERGKLTTEQIEKKEEQKEENTAKTTTTKTPTTTSTPSTPRRRSSFVDHIRARQGLGTPNNPDSGFQSLSSSTLLSFSRFSFSDTSEICPVSPQRQLTSPGDIPGDVFPFELGMDSGSDSPSPGYDDVDAIPFVENDQRVIPGGATSSEDSVQTVSFDFVRGAGSCLSVHPATLSTIPSRCSTPVNMQVPRPSDLQNRALPGYCLISPVACRSIGTQTSVEGTIAARRGVHVEPLNMDGDAAQLRLDGPSRPIAHCPPWRRNGSTLPDLVHCSTTDAPPSSEAAQRWSREEQQRTYSEIAQILRAAGDSLDRSHSVPNLMAYDFPMMLGELNHHTLTAQRRQSIAGFQADGNDNVAEVDGRHDDHEERLRRHRPFSESDK